MSRMPECRSMNFSIYEDKLNRYKDSEELKNFYKQAGLNGLEVIRAVETGEEKIRPEMVNGVHLYYHIFWMDWWKQDYSRLDEEFDSRTQWMDYYGGTDRNLYLDALRKDLEYAEAMGAKYVVFHVSEVTLRESYLYQYKYTDEEVIDASLEIINTLLDEREYPFDFLVENLWWSGLNLKDISVTKRLMDGIHSEKKGIMVDFGHYMNTNPELKTPEEGIAYLHQLADQYEEAGLLSYFKGVHLHLSLSGEYVKEQKMEWEESPIDFEKIPFYELFRLVYTHMHDIDQHKPFLCDGIRELTERFAPQYITYEFHKSECEDYLEMLKEQSRLLGYLS